MTDGPVVRVTDDPAEMDRLRAAGAYEAQPMFADPIVNLTYRASQGDARALVNGLSDRELEQLASASEDPHRSMDVRMRAALLLGLARPAASRDRVASLLSSDDACARWEALNELTNGRLLKPETVAHLDVRAIAAAAMHGDDPSIVACGIDLSVLEDPDATLPARAVTLLLELHASPARRWRANQVLTRLVLREREPEASVAARALVRSVAGPPAEPEWVCRRTIEFAAPVLRASAPDTLVALCGDPDPSIGHAAFYAAAPLRGRAAVAELFQRLEDPEQRYQAIEPLGEILRDTRDEEAVRRLIVAGQARSAGSPFTPSAAALALIRIGGTVASRAALELGPFYARDGQRVLWALTGLTADDAWREAVAAGILDALPGPAELASVRASLRHRPFAPIDEVDAFWRWMHDRRTCVEVEFKATRTDYQLLFRTLTSCTRGRCHPEAMVQLDRGDAAGDGPSETDLAVKIAGRVYSVSFRNPGRAYDADAILALIDRVLEDSGGPERLVYTAGVFFFGRPEAVQAFCARFFLPGSERSWAETVADVRHRLAL